MPFCQVNGLKFHYQQAGHGPDIVLVHGVTGDLSIWFLCKAIQTLSQRYRVTALRHPRPRLQRRPARALHLGRPRRPTCSA